MKRLIPTPQGTAYLESKGPRDFDVVDLTLFNQDGRVTHDRTWVSLTNERLAAFLVTVTGLADTDAERVARELVAERARAELHKRVPWTHHAAAVLGLLLPGLTLAGLLAGARARIKRHGP